MNKGLFVSCLAVPLRVRQVVGDNTRTDAEKWGGWLLADQVAYEMELIAQKRQDRGRNLIWNATPFMWGRGLDLAEMRNVVRRII